MRQRRCDAGTCFSRVGNSNSGKAFFLMARLGKGKESGRSGLLHEVQNILFVCFGTRIFIVLTLRDDVGSSCGVFL